MSRALAAVLGLAVLSALVPAVTGAATRSKDISPYETFSFKYTSTKPDTRTGFKYAVALKDPPAGQRPPIVEKLQLGFAKGTVVDFGAVPACTATDSEISEGGPIVCPTKGRIATGTAGINTGPEVSPLQVDANVFVTGKKGLVVVLESAGTTVSVIRGTLSGTTLTIPIPVVEVNPGIRAALVQFNLSISGGSSSKPVFNTPDSCPKDGWAVTYAPTFTTLGKVKLTDVTKCKSS